MAAANPLLTASISVGSDLAEIAEHLRRVTVQVRGAGGRSGSGVIWRPDGTIVTNAHVATSSGHTVELADGRVLEAALVRRDARQDLAALRIAANGLRSAETRAGSSLRTGDPACGSPWARRTPPGVVFRGAGRASSRRQRCRDHCGN